MTHWAASLKPYEAKAFLELGRLEAASIEPMMTCWLESGLDGGAIASLAFEPAASVAEVEEDLRSALAEAGAGFDLSEQEATWIYIRYWLTRLLDNPDRSDPIRNKLSEFEMDCPIALFEEDDLERLQASEGRWDIGYGERLALQELFGCFFLANEQQLDAYNTDQSSEIERICRGLLSTFYSIEADLPECVSDLRAKLRAE